MPPYEHKQEVKQAVESIDNIVAMLVDQVPDTEQLAAYFIEANRAIAAIGGPLQEETKAAYDAKIVLAVALGIAKRRIPMLGLNEKQSATVSAAIDFAWRITSIQLPDSES